jgi:hypothetical protein
MEERVNRESPAYLARFHQLNSQIYKHLQARMWHPYGLRVTGVNCTELAEDAANHFNAYEPPNAALPDRFVAWAIEIAQEQA